MIEDKEVDIFKVEQSKEIESKYFLEKGNIEPLDEELLIWEEVFSILAWKIAIRPSGEVYINTDEVVKQLKEKFVLTRK